MFEIQEEICMLLNIVRIRKQGNVILNCNRSLLIVSTYFTTMNISILPGTLHNNSIKAVVCNM